MIARAAAAALAASVLVAAPTHAAPASDAAGCTVRLHPGDAVNRAVTRAGERATVCFAPGTYRLRTPLRPRAGQTLVGDDATLSGARVLRGFRRTGDAWVVGGQTQQGERTGTCARGTACTYPDGVLRDGRPLRRVLRAADLDNGTFFLDYRHDRVLVVDDPRGHVLEAMVAPAAIQSRPGAAGADVTVRGLTVEHVASRAQHGAIETSAPGWTIEGTTVRVNHGAGITSQGHVRILHNRVLRNGQLGIGGTGTDTLVRGNRIVGNNTGGFDPGWEAGGGKWAVTTHLVVSHNVVLDNHGPGLWTDIDALDTTYAANVVRRNDRAGIFHEISGSATIRDNVVTGNGHGYDTWLWGAGILLAGSHDVTVTGNRLAGNAAGIGLIQQDRDVSDRDGAPRTLHDLAFTDNETTMAGGDSGAVTDNGFDSMFDDPTITWTDNTWHGTATGAFAWADDYLDAAGWQALGHDVDGTFD